jgi:predicted Zn-dependent protease
MGLMFMAIAGYDPAEAAPFWQRMSAGGQSPPEFFSTHPNPDKRAQRLQELLPSANEYYQKYKRP